MSHFIDRTGEEKLMNNGLRAKIIAYRNNQDIDVEFENGGTVYKREYKWFMRGSISCPMIISDKGEYAEIINPNKKPETIFIMDIEDILLLGKYLWCINDDGYVMRNTNPGCIRLHRLIVNAPADMEVDHINGNRTDNRKCNLRLCSYDKNSLNRGTRSDNTTKYKGVSIDKKSKKYWARIQHRGMRISLGYYDTAEAAARAYNEAAIECHGEFARFNAIN